MEVFELREIGDDLTKGPLRSFMGVSQQRQRAIELKQLQSYFLQAESIIDSKNRRDQREEGRIDACRR